MSKDVLPVKVIVVVFVITMLYGKHQLFAQSLSEPLGSYTSQKLSPSGNSYFEKSFSKYLDLGVTSLIRIWYPNDIQVLRKRLIKFLWSSTIPNSLPKIVLKDVYDFRYKDLLNLERIDKLIVQMDFGLESYIYHFVPRNSNNKVVLYHQGHGQDVYESKQQIQQLISNGYSVVALCMPLAGSNNQPSVSLPQLGQMQLKTHDDMKFLIPETGHAIKYFIEPVIATLNYLERTYKYQHISMVGISGGGWTTTLAAAIDPRIKMSFPVAGSYPFYLRSAQDWGDWEQTESQLYNTVDYLDLYVLGAYGAGRKQVQIINQYDSCCFAGMKWQTYKDIVRSRVHQLGLGEFDLFLDDTHKNHLVSQASLTVILDELQNRIKPK